MTEDQEDKLIEAVCSKFDELDKSVDSLQDVKRVFNECITVLQDNGLAASASAEDEDFVEPEDSEVVVFAISTHFDGEETELEFNFEYTLIDGKYLIFADLDFHNAGDDDTETTDSQ